MGEKASDELGYRQGHGLVQITVFGPVVLWRDNLDEERATITMRIWCRDFLMIAVFLVARKVDF